MDPLSPLLFNIAMDGIASFLDKSSRNGFLSRFSVKERGKSISHFHYADDTILFLKYDWEGLHFVFSELKCFEITSGLSVNNAKTRLVGISDTPFLNF